MTARAACAPTVVVRPRPAPLAVTIRPVRLDDLPYVYGSFAEGRKEAPGLASMSWRAYKEHVVPRQREVFAHPETQVLAAYLPGGAIVGWIAYWPRRPVSVVHWVHARGMIVARDGEPPQPHDGERLRRRGVMTSLFDAAALGRIAYTHQGGRARHNRDDRTMDDRLLPWLIRRGHHPVLRLWKEWL